jgi:hypothetical protein
MSKFTPGPWLATCHGSAFVIKSESNQYIASADRRADDNMANAQLIATAPDLLEALKQIHAQSTRFGPDAVLDNSWIARVAAKAIAKAGGRHE